MTMSIIKNGGAVAVTWRTRPIRTDIFKRLLEQIEKDLENEKTRNQ